MGDVVELRSGLATAAGPVPSMDGDDAVDLVLRGLPELPSVPSRGAGPTSLLAQAVDGVEGIDALPSGMLDLHPDRAAPGGLVAPDAVVLGPAYDDFRRFLARLAAHAADTPDFVGVRVALVGPVSLALGLRAAGAPIDDACAFAGSIVARRAEVLLGELRRVLPDATALMCLNESGLVGAMHPTFPLAPGTVLELLDRTVTALDVHPAAGSLLIGAHVPGRTDWETVVSSGVSVLSLPVTAGLVGWADTLGGFLERGGRLAWGAVPVDQPLGTSEELLWRRLSGTWCELVAEGLDPLVLRQRSLVSPVDGLGHFGSTQAALALDLVGSLSTRVRRQAVAARLSLGA